MTKKLLKATFGEATKADRDGAACRKEAMREVRVQHHPRIKVADTLAGNGDWRIGELAKAALGTAAVDLDSVFPFIMKLLT